MLPTATPTVVPVAEDADVADVADVHKRFEAGVNSGKTVLRLGT